MLFYFSNSTFDAECWVNVRRKAKNKGRFRSKYCSAKNAEKEMYSIKRNVDNMLREPSLKNERKHKRKNPIL